MSDIAIDPNIHSPMPGNIDTASAPLAGGSDDGKVKDKTSEVVRDMIAIVQNAITVSTNGKVQVQGTAGVAGNSGIPLLDDPLDPEALLQDLEKLIAFLQLDNDQRQSELARARIQNQQGVMDKRHTERLAKIDESIKAAKKAEKAALASRIFGWLGAIAAVFTAVVMCVVTGGAAAGFAIAGAALAVTQLVLSETGGAEAIIDAMAESMQDTFGLDSAKAKAWASGIYTATFIVLGLATAGASAGIGAKVIKGVADATSAAARLAMYGTQIANIVMGLTGAGMGAATTAINYDATNAGAEVKDINRYVAIIQQLLEESEEELQQILEKIQSLYNQLVAIIQSKTETGNLIVEQMNQMV